jgi:hypothetical protein
MGRAAARGTSGRSAATTPTTEQGVISLHRADLVVVANGPQ